MFIGENNQELNSNNGGNTRKVDTLYPSWGFVRVPNGYTLVSENLNGDVRVRDKGFRFVWPWESHRTFVSMNDVPVDYVKEEYTSSEGYTVIVDTAVTYRITDAAKQFVEENAFQQLNLKMSSILRRLISKYNYKELAEVKIDLDSENSYDNFEWIREELIKFESKYGIRVGAITIQKAELHGDLKKSQEENTLNNEKNKRNIATARAEKEIAQLNADAEKIKGSVAAEISAIKLRKLVEEIGTDTPEKLKLLREVLIGANAKYTIIENSSNDPEYSMATKLVSVNDAITDSDSKVKSRSRRQKTKVQ